MEVSPADILDRMSIVKLKIESVSAEHMNSCVCLFTKLLFVGLSKEIVK